ncbi:MAG: aspartate/glutamate racemase family protein [Pseudotabrizicola sp.]|uniref:aspartate/glutamate racemase family protein n=1 Tax=Pseudotabrizicola sp. TaxID=2939647 RepID=UPI0027165BA8|nr:aspartate/glutamate racemase family protein [Pseudotabrizicola sp.]MDO9638450.1 aspartate/glutamate racemase family protein [Pseudotabrizicola sp.]
MNLLFLNPNSTVAMTQAMVAVARATDPEAQITGWTNTGGPPAIQGPEDGAAAVAGLLAMLPSAREAGADAIVIGCFDDTGLAQIRATAHCPVIGIGQAAFHVAALLGHRVSVITTLQVSVPVIAANIAAYGFADQVARVRASGLGVLEVDEASPAAIARLDQEILLAGAEDGISAVVLGCAGMAPLVTQLAHGTPMAVIDGVAAATRLARSLVAQARRI